MPHGDRGVGSGASAAGPSFCPALVSWVSGSLGLSLSFCSFAQATGVFGGMGEFKGKLS